MMGNRLLLCIHYASQEHIQMAFDYWAGSIKEGDWVWVESVKEIALRYSFKDSAVLQKVREAATAFDPCQGLPLRGMQGAVEGAEMSRGRRAGKGPSLEEKGLPRFSNFANYLHRLRLDQLR